jgi:UDP-N-acetylglucosamine--dolichyl-phosphate N-acetylglucosaminephosphotransferase
LLETYLPPALLLIISFALTFLLLPPVSNIMRKYGIVGVDVHKLDRPLIPEMCGLALVVGVTASTIVVGLFYSRYVVVVLAFVSATLIVAVVGAVDRLTNIGPKLKPVLTAFGAVPILLLSVYSPRPVLPFIGATRLTIIYPILIFVAIAVTSNSTNMLDVFNGSLTGTCSVATGAIIVCTFLVGRTETAALAAALLGGLIAFHIYNRYPAKVFLSDIGSLYVGAAIGALAILGHVEVAAVTAMMPQIMNSFYGLVAVGRLYERREISARPIKILSDGRLTASRDVKAPITLSRMILARTPLKEYEVTKYMVVLSSVSAILAIFTQLLIVWR